jgi:hypothetical protein
VVEETAVDHQMKMKLMPVMIKAKKNLVTKEIAIVVLADCGPIFLLSMEFSL